MTKSQINQSNRREQELSMASHKLILIIEDQLQVIDETEAESVRDQIESVLSDLQEQLDNLDSWFPAAAMV